jgi:hypothetical protein
LIRAGPDIVGLVRGACSLSCDAAKLQLITLNEKIDAVANGQRVRGKSSTVACRGPIVSAGLARPKGDSRWCAYSGAFTRRGVAQDLL